ncbi:hypothetical protein HN014_08565 [Aquimarina sp. TRL1]|uniref:HD domain-containing protein n=1 Tax=Aquimarina sp. (strain TRL1) TaxID=2736252 RepID=UPI00158D6405|nr:hypothetical protein [Aquimarina sp. TRL1]QKX04966.1 hypothetical protein HN014_08565 [Aquimarina sp. TRL1]
MLKQVFLNLCESYTDDFLKTTSLWNEIEKEHTKPNRYYHNISHLVHVYQQLLSIKPEIIDWDILLFSLFYHDFIYNILKKNNEEASADKAVQVLNSLQHISKERIDNCHQIILATKNHQINTNSDVNYFTDADLSILGASWQTYTTYINNIRKEYKLYPDFLYNKGRKQVLRQLLAMPQLYKTPHFKKQYELQARQNITAEIKLLEN